MESYNSVLRIDKTHITSKMFHNIYKMLNFVYLLITVKDAIYHANKIWTNPIFLHYKFSEETNKYDLSYIQRREE